MLLQQTKQLSTGLAPQSKHAKAQPNALQPSVRSRANVVKCQAVYTNGAKTTVTGNQVLKKEVLARDPDLAEKVYLASRAATINSFFPGTLAVHDYIQRVDIALAAYGFDGNNSIAMTNLCRDEVTATLRHEIEQIFGASFNTNGLGAVLTCGVTGIKAGLSHAPTCSAGRERYVFFSFPHISIDASGNVGAISRPGRAGASCACGALIGALGSIKETGMQAACKRPGVHDALDPELSILKQRLARRMRWEGWTESQVKELDLVDITKVAERTITDDLKYLIQHSVDPAKADYAVVTGVEVHNYGVNFDDDEPNLEFIWPTNCYVVINGEKTYLDLDSIPALPARQIELLSGGAPKTVRQVNPIANSAVSTTVRSIDAPFLYSTPQELKAQKERATMFAAKLDGKPVPAVFDEDEDSPMWRANLSRSTPFRTEDDNSSIVDLLGNNKEIDALTEEFMDRIKVLAAKKMAEKANSQ